MSTFEFHNMFPDGESAVKWFEAQRWRDGRFCPHCGSTNTVECAKPQPYRCRDCRKHFSVKVGTVMQSARLSVRKWLYAMYLMQVSKKGLSSRQLAQELGVSQEAAWRLGHKIREAWNDGALFPMSGEVEVDEACIGGKERKKHRDKKLKAGCDAVGKQPDMGMRERGSGKVCAFPVDATDSKTLKQHIRENIEPGSTVYTDGHAAYRGMREFRHEVVAHSSGEYVRDKVHTNGIESFWALLKRGIVGSYHYVSVKHLSRYVDEFSHRRNEGDVHPLASMTETLRSMEGRRLVHRQLLDGEAT